MENHDWMTAGKQVEFVEVAPGGSCWCGMRCTVCKTTSIDTQKSRRMERERGEQQRRDASGK
eukprot:2102483-Rhodomonas_salina.1